MLLNQLVCRMFRVAGSVRLDGLRVTDLFEQRDLERMVSLEFLDGKLMLALEKLQTESVGVFGTLELGAEIAELGEGLLVLESECAGIGGLSDSADNGFTLGAVGVEHVEVMESWRNRLYDK